MGIWECVGVGARVRTETSVRMKACSPVEARILETCVKVEPHIGIQVGRSMIDAIFSFMGRGADGVGVGVVVRGMWGVVSAGVGAKGCADKALLAVILSSVIEEINTQNLK